MRKKSLMLSGLICLLVLAACTGGGDNSGAARESAVPVGNGQRLTALQLALGVLQLGSQEDGINQAQAAELLPLWKAARSLANSDTTADEEVSALVKQIQQSFSDEQLQSIQAMSQQEMVRLASQYGVEIAALPGASNPSASGSSGDNPGMPPQGGFDGGGPPMMGGIPGMGGGRSPRTTQSVETDDDAGEAFAGVDPVLLEAVIDLLKLKAQ